MRRRDIHKLKIASAIFFALGLFAGVGTAQPVPIEDIPPEILRHRLRVAGDSIRFCVHSEALIADFDRAIAAELGSILLLDVDYYEIIPPARVPSLDYRMPLSNAELFVFLTDNCDAFLGFTLAAGGYPDWMTFTRGYLRTRFVLAATDQGFNRMGDLPRDQPIGTRSLSQADIHFASFLRSLPEQARWRRFPYPDNAVLVERLLDGTIIAALVWEPALYAATGGNPGNYGVSVISLEPMAEPIYLEFGVALREREAFLRTIFDQGIVALIEEGVVEELLDKHDLPGRPGSLGR